jgi:protein gp37
MGKNSHIEWTHHTFNPWWGCAKVSPACAHCYAEVLTNRFGGAIWGLTGKRRFFGDAHWNEPTTWNVEAQRIKTRFRVFCASMSDVFEDRRDLDAERVKLWTLIERTKSLDWLLLTKRPEYVQKLVPWGEQWPDNVWLGTSVENQEWADKRVPQLLMIPAKTRFLSCEPLLGTLDLSRYAKKKGIHWIIAGGESGKGARPMHPDWVRSLRDFAAKEGIAFHFKQWGNFVPTSKKLISQTQFIFPDQVVMVYRSKTINGRTLDGKTHDEFPMILSK